MARWGLTRGIPPDLEYEVNHLKTGQSAFQRKGDIIVQTDTRIVQLKSMIHDATVVEGGRKHRRTELEIKKSYSFPVQ